MAGDLHFVDGIVAENGAVVYFPDSGHTSALAQGVQEKFLAELNRRGIRFRAGRSLVDCDAAEAQRLLEVIRALELPLVLVFNAGRVMTMPQGVSKATGLQAALDILRLSPRNCLAIGDADNDHELLRLAEVGVAVQWGSAALRSAADFVINGSGPSAVTDFLRQFEGGGHLPVPPRARRRLLLGYAEDGRALRYPDRSVVIDLSHRPQDEKLVYIRTLLPALNRIRHDPGLPHRILVDEVHYFLQDVDARHLLDLERNGYTFVSYWASRLPKELLAATEVMIVTRESSPSEIEALCKCCLKCGEVDRGRWAMLSGLRSGQAVALPVTEEAAGDLRRFTIGPRLTPHVRHREKYVDVPVTDHRAFVFTAVAQVSAYRARTLREFVTRLEHEPAASLQGYLRRNDFSRWIADVFGDRLIAEQVRGLEARHRAAPTPNTVPEIASAIRERYDLVEEEPSRLPVPAPG